MYVCPQEHRHEKIRKQRKLASAENVFLILQAQLQPPYLGAVCEISEVTKERAKETKLHARRRENFKPRDKLGSQS